MGRVIGLSEQKVSQSRTAVGDIPAAFFCVVREILNSPPAPLLEKEGS